jgi:hypothetical protein
MKARVANMLICRHFDKWVESIEDPAVKEAVQKNTILTGGALVTLLTTNDVNDFDFYFRDRATALVVAKYYVQKFKENPPAKFRDGRNVLLYVDAEDPGGRVKIVAKSAGIVGEGSTANAAYGYFENESTTEGPREVPRRRDGGEHRDGTSDGGWEDKEAVSARVPDRERDHAFRQGPVGYPVLRRARSDPRELRLRSRHELLDELGSEGRAAGRSSRMHLGEGAAVHREPLPCLLPDPGPQVHRARVGLSQAGNC